MPDSPSNALLPPNEAHTDAGDEGGALPHKSPSSRAPWPVFAAAGTAALLHFLPFLRTRLAAPTPGNSWIGTPYIPPDWLAYIALVREEPRAGQLLLANPFTTEPQDGRLVLLLHQILNGIHRATAVDPGWLLEISRAALIVAFALTLFRFLDGFFDARTRTWAVVVTLLGGGLDFVALWAARWLPPNLAEVVRSGLWSMHGWTTYQALYNPLWAAGLTLLLLGLRPLLQPGGPASRRDVVRAGVALFACFAVHPYSAIAMVAILAAAVAGEWIVAGRFAVARASRMAAAVAPAVAAILLVALWQLGDSVVRRTTGGVLGDKANSVFWYPVAWAAVGVFALQGWRAWVVARHPWRYALGGWLVGIALLHASPLFSGYRYVAFAYLPVAIFAAGPIARAFQGPRRGWAVVLAGLLFSGTAVTAARELSEVEQFQFSRDDDSTLQALATLPPGNVLCEAVLGNAVPAYGPHRVYVGHWFMTPDYTERATRVASSFLEPPGDVPRIVEAEHIDYVVVPVFAAQRIAAALEELAPTIDVHGRLALIRLKRR